MQFSSRTYLMRLSKAVLTYRKIGLTYKDMSDLALAEEYISSSLSKESYGAGTCVQVAGFA